MLLDILNEFVKRMFQNECENSECLDFNCKNTHLDLHFGKRKFDTRTKSRLNMQIQSTWTKENQTVHWLTPIRTQ